MKTLLKITALNCLLYVPTIAQSLNGDTNFWIARGGCWWLSDSLITGRGYVASAKLYSQKSYNDFIFEVRFAKTAESGPCSILFHYNEEKDEGYHLMCHPYSGPALAKVMRNATSYIFPGSSVHWKLGMNKWNMVRVEATDSRYDFFINGEKIFSHTGAEYSWGKVGLIVWGDPRQAAQFRILKLK